MLRIRTTEQSKVGEPLDLMMTAGTTVEIWLAVIGRVPLCFQSVARFLCDTGGAVGTVYLVAHEFAVENIEQRKVANE